MTNESRKKSWIAGITLVLLLLAVTAVGVWIWGSLGFVSTDDARVKANIVTISTEVSGRIVDLPRDEGDQVKPGDVMVSLDTTELLIQIAQTQANVDRARSLLLQSQRELSYQTEKQHREVLEARASLAGFHHNLEDAMAHAAQARADWKRAKQLADKDLIPAQELAHAVTEFRQSQARVAALKEKIKEAEASLSLVEIKAKEVGIKEADLQARSAMVREAEARLEDLKHKLSLMTIRSPVDGIVVKKNAHRGEFVQAGQSVLLVVDSSRYWIEANIDETEIRFVKPGENAIVTLDSYPGVSLKGRVEEVGGATTSEFSLFSPQKLTGVFIKSTQKLPVKISVENNNGILRVGMLAVVWIEKPDAEK